MCNISGNKIAENGALHNIASGINPEGPKELARRLFVPDAPLLTRRIRLFDENVSCLFFDPTGGKIKVANHKKKVEVEVTHSCMLMHNQANK